jgi:hypothetical protein
MTYITIRCSLVWDTLLLFIRDMNYHGNFQHIGKLDEGQNRICCINPN